MIINRPGDEFEYEGVIYIIGGPIVGTQESEYEGLYGSITEIRDGEDKETENETPDFYCAFAPPVLPCEIKKLEETFSNLYDQPKTLDDIILDCVIMAPSMVKPLTTSREISCSFTVYLLHEDWAMDGEQGSSVEVYTDYHEAKCIMVQKLLDEWEHGIVPIWCGQTEFVQNSTSDSYEAYLDGEYMENHFVMSIISKVLYVSEGCLREATELYQSACQLEDLVAQISDWDELDGLTDEQYQRLIRDRRFPERLEKALGRNDYYWETVSEVAHELVDEYLQENSHPNNDEQDRRKQV